MNNAAIPIVMLQADNTVRARALDLLRGQYLSALGVLEPRGNTDRVAGLHEGLVCVDPYPHPLVVADSKLDDLNDVIVHLMLPQTRAFYNLEKLWEVSAERRSSTSSPSN